MCWTSKKEPILRIAPRNIPVIKILEKKDERLFSPVMRNAEWFLGMLALEDDLLSSRKCCSKRTLRFMISFQRKVDKKLGRNRTYVMCAAHIPKGAQYYMNKEAYVSNRLVVDKIVSVIDDTDETTTK